ncbi:hypothetical protein [Terrisporobacter sp.]|uniref:hypothetical protein n=1 Tax=Terrisporobacter sp. TaxID=1965305 RepID=UPI0028A0FF4F|nr:hypothetical protein [Terrisporobacter sp.]
MSTRLNFRRKAKKYTEVYNTIIFKNKNVELTGLYTTIQACIDLELNTAGTDKEFILSKKTLQHYCGYKEDKFKRIWNELKKAGYLKQYKIKNKNGKFEYEYELLDEPDLTMHHSLIVNDDGSLTPNIPKSKLDKLKNTIDEIPGGENPPVVPEGENPHSGKKGDYYNTFLNKVCKYVCIAKENFALTNNNKEYIQTIKEQIELDLFEQIVVDAKNKNKTFSYVVGTIDNCLKENITNLTKYEENKKNYKQKAKRKSTGSSAPETKATNETTSFKTKRNSQNCLNESFRNYTPEELEKLLKESQKGKF